MDPHSLNHRIGTITPQYLFKLKKKTPWGIQKPHSKEKERKQKYQLERQHVFGTRLLWKHSHRTHPAWQNSRNLIKAEVRVGQQSKGRGKTDHWKNTDSQTNNESWQNESNPDWNERDQEVDGTQGSVDALEGEHPSKLLNMYLLPNTEVSRSSETPLYVKKDQKINDRLQEKINILKTQTHLQDMRSPFQSRDALNRPKEPAKDVPQGRKIKET